MVDCWVLDRGTSMDQVHHRAARDTLSDLEVAMVPSRMKLDRDMIQEHEECRYRRLIVPVGKNLVVLTNEKGQEDYNESRDNLLQLGSFLSYDLLEGESLSDDVCQLVRLGR